MKSSPDLRALVGVVLAGEHERVLDAVAVDLHRRVRGVLGDDREQVVEQPRSNSLRSRRSSAGRAAAAPLSAAPGSSSWATGGLVDESFAIAIL